MVVLFVRTINARCSITNRIFLILQLLPAASVFDIVLFNNYAYSHCDHRKILFSYALLFIYLYYLSMLPSYANHVHLLSPRKRILWLFIWAHRKRVKRQERHDALLTSRDISLRHLLFILHTLTTCLYVLIYRPNRTENLEISRCAWIVTTRRADCWEKLTLWADSFTILRKMRYFFACKFLLQNRLMNLFHAISYVRIIINYYYYFSSIYHVNIVLLTISRNRKRKLFWKKNASNPFSNAKKYPFRSNCVLACQCTSTRFTHDESSL